MTSATRCAWGKNFPAAHHLDLTVSLYALGNDQGKREDTITGEGTEKLWELCRTTDAGWFEPAARPTYISPRERWWCPFTEAFCFTVTPCSCMPLPCCHSSCKENASPLTQSWYHCISGGWWDLELLRTTATGVSVQWKQRWQTDPQTMTAVPQNASLLPVWWQNIWGFSGVGG